MVSRKRATQGAQAGAGGVDPDALVARDALLKELEGVRLTEAEKRALKRWQKAEAHRVLVANLQAIPLGVWSQAAGRHIRQIKDQSVRYSLPMSGPTINLYEFLPALHRLLAANWAKFSREASEEDLLSGGGNSPQLERYRRFKADLLAIELKEKRRELLPREETRGHLGELASILRGTGEALERECGPRAREVFESGLDDFRDRLKAMRLDPPEEDGGAEKGA